jgi:hydrophobic/amphiphilic exporter-1 (mainly G- bacteria), HAE1 family
LLNGSFSKQPAGTTDMSIWDICIRRPVFTLMLMLAPIVLGMVSYGRLGVDLFPNVDLPLVVITTTLQGADVEQMESEVTKPLEEAVNTISGIDELRSTTKEGISLVMIGFVLEKNGDIAAQEVRDKVATVLARLPQGADQPIIEKFALDAMPVTTIVVSGKRDRRELTEIVRKRLKENLETVHGVGSVVMVGGQKRAINISMDPDLLEARGLSVDDVKQALMRQNVELAGGRVDQPGRELVVRTEGRVRTPEDFNEVIITVRNGYPIRIKEVATINDGVEEERGLSRLDGDQAISLYVQKQSGTNTVQVVDAVRKRLEKIKTDLPADIRIVETRDTSRFIRLSIEEVKVHLFLAAGLVTGVVFLFIRDWRTTIIAGLAVPTSIVGVFAIMDWMGFTLNNITLLGLILAVGLVIDDAVVVLENVFRHMEEFGSTPAEAASIATREIALAVIATTFSLVVIFAPVMFMGGRVGRFFSSFGWVVGISVLLSLVVSLTLTPMLCARFLKPLKHDPNAHDRGIWGWITRRYVGILAWSLRHRWVIVLATLGLFMSIPFWFTVVKKEFLPKDDQSEFIVDILLPEGTNLKKADELTLEIEQKLRQLRGVTSIFTVIGDTSGKVARGQGDVTHAVVYVRMIDLKERPYTQFDVMRDARAMLTQYPDLRTTVQEAKPFANTGMKEVLLDLNLRGPDTKVLQGYADELVRWMRAQDGKFVDVDTSLSLRKPELPVKIDREKAADLGISVQAAASTLALMIGGQPVTTFKEGGEIYDVWLRAKGDYRQPHQVQELSIPSDRGTLVKVGSFATANEQPGPNEIARFGRQRQVVVSANLEGMVLGDAIILVAQKIKEMNLPPEYQYEFLGQAKLQSESDSNFMVAFLLAFIFMYMILAAQFESLLHPVTIMLAVPLTLPFALMSLLALNSYLDIYAILGLFMLFGVVKKNGILQVDYTNVLREKGMPVTEAILEANRTRLRPILMTTFMLVAAMVPIATGSGPGASARASMAKVILGGQFLSLLLTLLITPVAYSMWDSIEQLLKRILSWLGRKSKRDPEPVVLQAIAEETVVEVPAVKPSEVAAMP